MPRTAFSPENKTTGIFDIERMRLTDMGQKARILILDEGPAAQYRHFVMTPAEANRTGSYYSCLGEEEIVRTGARDEERCPACKYAEVGSDVPVQAARRHFAVNIARYGTNNQGEPHNPLSIFLQIWSFGNSMYNRLIDQSQEYGNLQQHDILLKCTNTQFQNMEMIVSPRCLALEAAKSNDGVKAQLREVMKNMHADLDPVISRTVSYEELERAVSVSGIQAPVSSESLTSEGFGTDLGVDLGEGFDTDIPTEQPTFADTSSTDISLQDLLNDE